MRCRPVLLSAVAISAACSVTGCGDSRDDRPSSGSPSSLAGSEAPTSWKDPKDLLKALRSALEVGDSARVLALYDASDPAAAVKKRFWAALSEVSAAESRIRAAYTKKFGQPAWDADDNPVKWGTGGDFGLASSFERLAETRVDEENGMARVGVEKFIFQVVRRDGRCVAFREETFGGNDHEVKMVSDGVAKAKKVLAAVDAATDAADFRKRYEAIRAE
jgi:hypothetical protein